LNYRLGDMSGDDLACKIRELRGENTILVSAYDREGNMVTNLKQKKKNCIVVESIRELFNLTLLMGRIEQYV
jgi:hypothetical protein